MKFNSVKYQVMPGIIAKVNRNTGDLFLNPVAWRKLSPSHRDFVLLHEAGHYILQDPTERGANHYAVSNYIKQATTVDEFGHRITIMSDLLMKESHMIDISSIGSIVGDIFGGLASVGIGSKSRQAEISAQAGIIAAQAQAEESKAMNQLMIYGAIGLIVIVSLVVYLKLKSKKQ